MMESLGIEFVISDEITNSTIPCLLCHQELAAVTDEHEKHLNLEHKVKFQLSWIIKKTWKEWVKKLSNVKEETLSEIADLDEQYFSASKLLAKNDEANEQSFESKPNKPYKCSFCGKGFKTKAYVEVHQKKHSGESVIMHNDEKKSIEENEQNFAWNPYKLYKCSFCEKGFKTKAYVEVHEKKHSGESVIVQKPIEETEQKFERNQCSFCEKSFKTKSYVEVHEKKHSGESNKTKRKSSIEENEQNLEWKPYQLYKCSFCEKGFKTKAYIEIHEKKHSGETAMHSDDKQKKIVDKDHEISRSNMCSFEGCEKKSVTIDDLKKHLKTHQKKKHKCSICGKGFKTKVYVLVHGKKNHNYQCSVCEKAFTSKGFTREHERKRHSLVEKRSWVETEKKKPTDKDHEISSSNMCSFEGCEKEFLTNDDLKKHLKTHQKKKHKCSICGKGFKTEVYVVVHEKKNHNYQCSFCEKAFTSNGIAREHERKRHSPDEKRSWVETDEKTHTDELEGNFPLWGQMFMSPKNDVEPIKDDTV